jgi:hypothetical protein
VGVSQIRGNIVKKLLLGDKQMETLEECVNLAINLCEGLEEYQADSKRYRDLRNKIENELYKQIVR